MAVMTPDWLKQRDGELQVSKDGRSGSVYFAGQLQYVVMPLPTKELLVLVDRPLPFLHVALTMFIPVLMRDYFRG